MKDARTTAGSEAAVRNWFLVELGIISTEALCGKSAKGRCTDRVALGGHVSVAGRVDPALRLANEGHNFRNCRHGAQLFF